MTAVDKNNPSPEWIASLRRRYPTEKEMDRVFTRKLQRRAGPGYQPLSLETFGVSLQSLLKSELKDGFDVRDLRWLTGGASKLQVAFTLDWNRPGVGRTTTSMVIRMEPAESIVESSRLREFQCIKAVGEVLPVPPVFWVDEEGKHFPYPALVYGFAEGVTKPSGVVSNVTGLGINFGTPELRKIIGDQFIDHLAKLHTWDWRKANLSAYDIPPVGARTFEMHLNWWQRVWEEDSNRDIPIIRLAASWLRNNMPVADRLVMIHSDFRAGNFLYTEHDRRISAWLDWEMSHLGDYHEDVAYTTIPSYMHRSEDGSLELANGMMPAEAMYEAYEKASGYTINQKAIDYYHIFHLYRLGVIVIATSYRAARNGKTHQDPLLVWIMGLGYVSLGLLREKLEEVG